MRKSISARTKILTLIAALLLLLSAVPILAFAQDGDGSSKGAALGVSSTESFRLALGNSSVEYIRIDADIVTAQTDWDEISGHKNVFSAGSSRLTLPESLDVKDDLTIENIQIAANGSNWIAANGNRLIFGEGVNTSGASSISLFGGSHDAPCGSGSRIEVYSGSFVVIYGGSHQAALDGDSTIIVGGNATIRSVYGGGNGYPAPVQGDTLVRIQDRAKVTYELYGGGFSDGLTGTATVEITGNAVVEGTIHGGSSGNGSSQNTKVVIDGNARVAGVYGGNFDIGYTSVLPGSTDILIGGNAQVGGDVYGGSSGYNSHTVNGDTRITIADSASISGKISGGSPTAAGAVQGEKSISFVNVGATTAYRMANAMEKVDTISIADSSIQFPNQINIGSLTKLQMSNSTVLFDNGIALPNAVMTATASDLRIQSGKEYTFNKVLATFISLEIGGVPADTYIYAQDVDSAQFATPMGYVKVQADENTLKFEPLVFQAMSVSTLPDQLEYNVGEALDLSGGQLRLSYQNGDYVTVAMEDPGITAAYDFTSPGTKIVTLTYDGFNTQFEVLVRQPVVDPYITSIAMDKNPDKLEYYIGEKIDLSGGILTVNYSDGSVKTMDMSDDNVRVDYSFVALGKSTVTVYYMEDSSGETPGGETPGTGLPGNSYSGSTSSGYGGRTSRVTSSSQTVTTNWMGQTHISKLVADAKSSNLPYIHIQNSGAMGMRKALLQELAGLTLQCDTVEGNAVQVRISIPQPEKAATDLLLSGRVTGATVNKVKDRFNKWFANKITVVSFDQKSAWGQPIEIWVRTDLTDMNTENLVFYAYSLETNTYEKIQDPQYFIDSNGYLKFTTDKAGEIIISEGELVKR